MSSSALFVRALYDFHSTDVSSLSFRRDDIIQVLTRLESGWWDGLCNGERGWFPSNYVTDLENEEEIFDENDQVSDWIPQQTPDGDVFYYNQRTGESAWELPIDDAGSANTRDSSSTNDGMHQSILTTSSSGSTTVKSMTDSPRSSVLSRSRRLPENWIQQPTEDGNTYYYYNTITKEIRWTFPGGEEVVDGEVDDVEAADKESIASSRGSRLSTSTIGTIQQRQQNQQQLSSNEGLPPNWGKKVTPQGRVYYYNKVTDETTWSLEDIDGDGNLVEADRNANLSPSNDPGDGESPHEIPLPPTPTATIPPPQPSIFSEPSILMMQNPNEILTWESLSNTVFATIHHLNLAAKENSKQSYKHCTNAIVESIRIMLYASGTVEKESPAIRQNRNLKIYHRHIMASLSKLVLSTKVASGVWPPPDAAQKMKSDADEVLVAVRQFVQAAENTVEIRRVDPKILESSTGGAWRGNNLPLIKPPSINPGANPQENGGGSLPSSPINQNAPSRSLTPDLLASLDHTSRTATKAITLLQNHVRKYLETPRAAMPNTSATFVPQLISQTRQTVTQVGQFLSLIEDINLEDLDETSQGTIDEFKIAKQALYNNIAGLVICTQSATDHLAPPNAIDQVQVSTSVVEKSVKDVIIATKFLVEEKETQDQLRINMRIPRRQSSTDVQLNRRRVNSTYSSINSTNSTLVSLDQIQEAGTNGVIDENAVTDEQPVGNGTPAVSNALQTVPEDDVMLTDSSTIAGDQGSSIEDYDAPMSPVSDGSSMTGGRSMRSSRLRSDSSVSSSALETTPAPNHPPLIRTNTQPMVSTSSEFSSYSSSPPASYTSNGTGSAKSPRPENNKVQKFFGEDVPSTIAQTHGQREDKPSFLNYDYDPSEIIFNMESHVKGGTLNALVERLTMHDVLDSNFIATFLLTYRSFCTTDEFFDMLVKRFMIQPPEGLIREEIEVWVEKKQTPIRLRVFNIMKSWLENYYIEREDAHCLERMREFVNTVMHEHMAFAATSLIRVIDKRQQQDKSPTKVMVVNAVQPPPSILPKNMKKIKFLELDPLEIARQLTIIESTLYNKIQPVECLNKAWSKEENVGGEIAENIKAMIVNSNQITGWVAESILNQPEIKKRCLLIKHFVAVADKCRTLNNFNSLTAIISGLNSAPIHRLKRTWEMVSARTIQTLENLNRIMNSTKNFSDYREMLHSVNPPCVYLTDLTFIEDGNPNIIKKSRQLINFSKRMKTAEVIREIQQYQSMPYFLNPVRDIQVFIQTHLQESKDVSELYNQSLNMEPSDDVRILSYRIEADEAERKKQLEEDYLEGGQRTAAQVACNALTGAIITTIHQYYYGGKLQCLLDDRGSRLLFYMCLGHYSTCNGDTWASELGILNKDWPILITTFKKVPPGTNGGVTTFGLLASVMGGFIIGVSSIISIFLAGGCNRLWVELIPIASIAGLVGSLIDSLLGATVQLSTYSEKLQKITYHETDDVKLVSGINLLNNNQVNFVSSLITALLTGFVTDYVFG
ncbi:17445_t:CDS:10 [Acaulospora morrowiae]|uniref:17445_t:CDS:1 n=1 Tax=Acaulospora morrowiae TaxID=94023 RepID=A0A9N8YMV5_9GLOM|nr:17445_t:CDS:10 [Acaulospora morrowiae]